MDEGISQLDGKVIELISSPFFMWPNLANGLTPNEAESVVRQLLYLIDRAEKLALFLNAYSLNIAEESTQNLIPPLATSDDNCVMSFMRWRCWPVPKRLLRKFVLWLIKVGDSLDE